MAGVLAVMQNVSVMLGGKTVLDDISFTLSHGDFVLLRGANGAGKTTLLKCLLGLYRPSAGTVQRFFAPGGAGYVPQLPGGSLVMPLLVRDTVAIGRCAHHAPWHRQTPDDVAAVEQALSTVGIAHLAARPIRMLSGGEQRKMHLARVLAQKPQALLLDEPTAHLDTASRLEFLELLKRIFTETAIAVLLVTHDEQATPSCCTREIGMRNHRLDSAS